MAVPATGRPGPARRRAPAALARGVEAAWPHVRDRLDARLTGTGRDARRLAREAEQARRAHARAVQVHVAAVARREGVLRASRRALPGGLLVAGGSTAASFLLFAPDGTPLLWGLAAAGAARAAVAARRLARPPAVPPAPVPLQPLPPAPPSRSAASAAVVRLDRARLALQDLLPVVVPAGREVAEEAWHAAGQADAALRWTAARLAAAEPHRGPDPGLLAELEAGAAAQERLVDAVADLVAAGADPWARERLQDVTDRVQGLAAGYREVRAARGW